MIKVTRTQTRPSLSIDFFRTPRDISQQWSNYFKENYLKTGKCLTFMEEISNNDLSLTLVTVWLSQEDFDDFKNDPTTISLLFNAQGQYERDNNIQVTVSVEYI